MNKLWRKLQSTNRYRELKDNPSLYARLKKEAGLLTITGKDQYLLTILKKGIKVTNTSNSLVAYVLGITDTFPEKEMQHSGGTSPDIDTDIPDVYRKKVIDYIKRRFGAKHVSGIGTFGYMQAKGAVRNIGRAMGLPYDFVDRVAKLIPDPIQGKNYTIDEALKEVDELHRLYEDNNDVKRLIDMAKKAEGLILNKSQHAAGVIISSEPLDNIISTWRNADNFPVSEFTKNEVEELGLLKMDELGLRSLSIISDAFNLIKERHGIEMGINDVPWDDPATYALFSTKKLLGVFQFGSAGLSDFAADFEPENIEHVTLLTAFFRPGPIQFKQQLLDIRHGRKQRKSISPIIDNILDVTYGFVVYQEQLMKIVQEYAGYTEQEADMFRKAVAKKIEEKMMKEKKKFFARAEALNRDIHEAERIWMTMEPFMNYGSTLGPSHWEQCEANQVNSGKAEIADPEPSLAG